jgi:preprotein translocase subunit SecB
MSDQNQPVFTIDKIYVKDLSLENPSAPRGFLIQGAPEVQVSIQSRGDPVENGVYESVLTVTVTAKVGEVNLFLVEAAQAGLFTIRNVPDADVKPMLGIHCPTILFPYVRETIADAIARAGFPAIHLDPVNFEALYQQQMQQMPQPVVQGFGPAMAPPAAN